MARSATLLLASEWIAGTSPAYQSHRGAAPSGRGPLNPLGLTGGDTGRELRAGMAIPSATPTPTLTTMTPASPGRAIGLFVAAAGLYLGAAALDSKESRRDSHFERLAAAFMQGSLSFGLRPEDLGQLRVSELIPIAPPIGGADAASGDGESPGAQDARPRAYCGYPPLPALVMIPFMLLLGEVARVATVTRLISAMNAVLLDSCLRGLHQRFGLGPATSGARLALVAAFAAGTAMWHNADVGGDWHLAHAVALTAMLAALREFTRCGRAGVIGVFIAAALLTRPTAALTGAMFVWPMLRERQWRRLLMLVVAPGGAVALLGAYNAARFGNPFDFGYDRMFLAGLGRALIDRFGQFHPVFLRRNFFWFFLAPPFPAEPWQAPYIGFSPFGMSLFVASPMLLYALHSLRRHRSNPVVASAVIGAALCLAPLLLYYNTGYWQFGHRFSMDYMMPLLVLAAAGVGLRPARAAYALMAVSVAIHAWGILLERVVHVRDFLLPAV